MSTPRHQHEPLTAEEAAQRYSSVLVDHALHPRNAGTMPNADGFGHVRGPCGDTIEFWLLIQKDRITRATFWTDGCWPLLACCSALTEIVVGKTVDQVHHLQPEEIDRALDGLPEGEEHCAHLTLSAMKAAVRDHLALQREPWKKVYRNAGTGMR